MSSIASTACDSTISKKQKVSKSGLAGHHGPSMVWKFFEKIKDQQEKWVGDCKCIYCDKIVTAPSGNGTNKLHNHIRSCPKVPADLKDNGQGSITFTAAALTWKFDQERCRNACAKMIIIDELPFCTVEKEGFRGLCAAMQPKFQLVSRPTITKDCYGIYFEEKKKLRSYLIENSTRVCITTDMWTSIQNLGYIVVTAHFVDKDWKLRKNIISFRVVPHPHKGEVIAKVLESCLLEWGFDRVMTITLDNAKNNDTCVEDLKKRLNKRSMLLLGGGFFHVRCFAHVMNLVVRDGIEKVKFTIKRLRRSVKYVRSSPSRMQIFRRCIEEEKLTYKRVVTLDVKTRWNSTYLMIDAALPYEKAFERFDEYDPSYILECSTLDSHDWGRLTSLHSFLEEFYLQTKRVSGSNYVCSHTYFDEVTNVKLLLIRELRGDDVDRVDMAKKMNEKFEKYCDIDKLNPIFLASVVLDPRNKMEYLGLWYDKFLEYDPSLTIENRKMKVESFLGSLKTFLSQLYECYKAEATVFLDVESSSQSQSSSLVNVPKNSIYNVRDEIRAKLKRKNTVEAMNDLDRYLSDIAEDNIDDFDILQWWKGKFNTYRALALMARDIFAIPITSVASERAFSSAGRVLDSFRSSLTPKLVESLVCCQDWLKSAPLVDDEETLEALEEIENGLRELHVGPV